MMTLMMTTLRLILPPPQMMDAQSKAEFWGSLVAGLSRRPTDMNLLWSAPRTPAQAPPAHGGPADRPQVAPDPFAPAPCPAPALPQPAPAPAPLASDPSADFLHKGFFCDSCHSPIRSAVRYKCVWACGRVGIREGGRAGAEDPPDPAHKTLQPVVY